MKKIATLFLAIIASGCFFAANADSTTIDSSSANTTNNSVSLGITNAGATQNISPNAAWASAIAGSNWISFANTGNPSGAGFYTVPNGTGVTFTQTFDFSGAITAATLSVLADDTASVLVNGHTVHAANIGGSFPTCSSVAIGCLTTTEGIFNIAPFLTDGMNTISFDVFQEAGSSFGLDYAATITTSSTTAPEPGVLMLLSSGLIGVGFLKIRRKLPSF